MSSVKPVPIAPAQQAAAGDSPSGPASVLSALEMARAARARRARKLMRNLSIWVGVPTLLSILYFGALARDQYESFAVLSVPVAQATLLREYVLSRDMLGKLEQTARFSEHYQAVDDDFAGLAKGVGSEKRYAFYLEKIDVRVEDAGIFRLKVRAMTGKDAARFAQVMVSEVAAFLDAHRPDPSAHVVVVSVPSRPSEPTYPNRAYGILTVFLVSAAFYAIGALLVAAAREHAQF
jgi:capsule polysaccharide export protein KpsE/RkpR